ncbi:MAG: valine--tRNA ligase, partial [Bdellovibrio sp.]
PYSILMPPPNVTGFLHMGHAMDAAIQDCLIRWKRMSGFNALWLPGIDHAGIATQVVVEKELKKQGLSRQQLGRTEFVKKVWAWKEQYGERISNQQKRLGASCDWSRRVFTLDESVSQVVRKVFVELHKKGLLYRGKKLVNWSGPLESAISDLEVEHRETRGTLYHIRYPLLGGEEFLTVATTRPETLLGDVAVAVHPEDARYQAWIGKKVRLPLVGREILVLADSFVDPQFGSGVVKITPAHDFNDEKVGRRHGLEFINILTPQMNLNEKAGAYKGLNLSQARKKILEDLRAQDLLVKEEAHTSSVGYCSRTGAVVEPYLSDQWFVRMQSLAEPAQRAIATGTLRIEPESWTKVYLHWLSIIEDWCVSRQLWWGHQIPAWHCAHCGHVTVSETPASVCEKCSSTELRQDEDVLDTWFSSALWPFSTLGWPHKTEAFQTFYPTSTLVTGHDILFFWVARMVMMGMEFTKDVPFRHIYLHGLVRDSQGRKMSKSLGNSIDPVDMIEKFGTDALRFSILAHIHSGKDLKISEQRIEGYRNFMNKLWNAARFCLSQFEKHPLHWEVPPRRLTPFDEWILVQLAKLEEQVDKS